MMSGFRHALGACGVFLGCSIALLISANRPAHASNSSARDRGAHVFHTSGCERCHSITGVGGDRAPDLSSVGQRRNSGQIRKQILNGGKGMPPFKTVLTKSEVKDLVVFLTSCRTDSAPGCREWTAAQPAQ
jgi:mono/diheme cytochrome c family protein